MLWNLFITDFWSKWPVSHTALFSLVSCEICSLPWLKSIIFFLCSEMNLPGRLDYSNLTMKTQVGLQWSNLKQLLGKYYVVTEFQLRVKSNIYILWWKPYMFRKGLVIPMFSCPLLISFGTPLVISWGWDSMRKELARTELSAAQQ